MYNNYIILCKYTSLFLQQKLNYSNPTFIYICVYTFTKPISMTKKIYKISNYWDTFVE